MKAGDSGQPDRRARFRNYFVYVLWFPKEESRYVGQTDNLVRRIRQHIAGRVCFSRNRKPFKLIYVEGCATRSEAVAREKYLKSRSGRRYLDRVLYK